MRGDFSKSRAPGAAARSSQYDYWEMTIGGLPIGCTAPAFIGNRFGRNRNVTAGLHGHQSLCRPNDGWPLYCRSCVAHRRSGTREHARRIDGWPGADCNRTRPRGRRCPFDRERSSRETRRGEAGNRYLVRPAPLLSTGVTGSCRPAGKSDGARGRRAQPAQAQVALRRGHCSSAYLLRSFCRQARGCSCRQLRCSRMDFPRCGRRPDYPIRAGVPRWSWSRVRHPQRLAKSRLPALPRLEREALAHRRRRGRRTCATML